MTYIVEDFQIDGQQVVMGPVHENDHVFGSKIAAVADLRHPNPNDDVALTVKQTKKVHALRTAHYARVKPKYDL